MSYFWLVNVNELNVKKCKCVEEKYYSDMQLYKYKLIDSEDNIIFLDIADDGSIKSKGYFWFTRLENLFTYTKSKYSEETQVEKDKIDKSIKISMEETPEIFI